MIANATGTGIKVGGGDIIVRNDGEVVLITRAGILPAKGISVHVSGWVIRRFWCALLVPLRLNVIHLFTEDMTELGELVVFRNHPFGTRRAPKAPLVIEAFQGAVDSCRELAPYREALYLIMFGDEYRPDEHTGYTKAGS